MNKLFTVLGGKLKFSAHDSDMEYSCWQCKYSSVSSDLKPPLPTRLHVTGLPKKQTDKFDKFVCSFFADHELISRLTDL